MRVEAKNYSMAFDIYENVLEKLERIISDFPESKVSHRLISGKIEISGLSLSEYRNLGTLIKSLAEGEQDLLSCALAIAKTIEGEDEYFMALSDIAKSYADVGKYKQAFEVVKMIDHEPSQAQPLSKIASSYAESGQDEQARKILAQALTIANTIQWELIKIKDLSKIAVIYIKIGEYKQAKEITQIIQGKDEWPTAIALSDIAVAYHEAGQIEHVEQLLTKALRLINTNKVSFDDIILNYARSEVAVAYAKIGKFNKAEEIIDKIHNNKYIVHQIRALSGVAVSYFDSGQNLNTTETFLKAFEIIDTTEDRYKQSRALGIIARTYARIGELNLALELLARIDIDEYHVREYVMTEIALAYTRAGFTEKTENLLSQSLKLTKRLYDENQVDALCRITVAYNEADVKLRKYEKVILQEIIQDIKPIEMFWENAF